jgi:putative Mg2+ transporter-C (MgtC) family protein
MTPEFLDFDFQRAVWHLVRLALAFLFALPVAWDRERQERTLGLRTFPLVAMASTGYILIAQTILGWESAEHSRIIQGLMTGIGFLGGGAIVKKGLTVHGTATAASIWSTAAIGAAVAYDRYEIAIALTLATFLTLRWLQSLKEVVGTKGEEEEAE